MSRVTLGEVCREYKGRPESDALPVVGLEHLSQSDIDLLGWSHGETTFTKGFRKGHVLFGRRRAYLKKASVAPFDGVCSGDIIVIEAIEDRLLPDLLPFVIQNDYLFDFAVENSAGSLSPRVKWKDLSRFEFALPSMEKQKELAELLQAAQDTKRAYSRLIAACDEMVKSRFIEVFGDPVTNSKGWQTDALKKNIELINGRAYKQSELLENGKYRILRVGNFFTNSSWYYSDMELDPDKYCDNGDLLYAWSASFGPRIWDSEKVIYHYHIWKLRFLTESYSKLFLKHLLDYAAPSFIGDAHGIGMVHLTKQGMESTPFIVPPIGLQQEFERFAMQVDKSELCDEMAVAA